MHIVVLSPAETEFVSKNEWLEWLRTLARVATVEPARYWRIFFPYSSSKNPDYNGTTGRSFLDSIRNKENTKTKSNFDPSNVINPTRQLRKICVYSAFDEKQALNLDLARARVWSKGLSTVHVHRLFGCSNGVDDGDDSD